MTTNKTPETIAQETWTKISYAEKKEESESETDFTHRLIAQALRDYANQQLERAALAVGSRPPMGMGSMLAANRIRALIDKGGI